MDEQKQKKLGVLENKINNCLKNISELKAVNMSMYEDIQLIKRNIIELNYKVPERQKGWLYDSWKSPPEKPMKVDYDSVQ